MKNKIEIDFFVKERYNKLESFRSELTVNLETRGGSYGRQNVQGERIAQ
jgi:hypothetical protein